MDEDDIIRRAAELLERRGYPRISNDVLWAIGEESRPSEKLIAWLSPEDLKTVGIDDTRC